MTRTLLSRSKGQLAGGGGVRAYCGGLPHSLLLLLYVFLEQIVDGDDDLYLMTITIDNCN